MTDNDADADTEQEAGSIDLPSGPNDATTPQGMVDSAVDRKGAEWVRENFERYFAPVKRLGYDISREDVEIPDPDNDDP